MLPDFGTYPNGVSEEELRIIERITRWVAILLLHFVCFSVLENSTRTQHSWLGQCTRRWTPSWRLFAEWFESEKRIRISSWTRLPKLHGEEPSQLICLARWLLGGRLPLKDHHSATIPISQKVGCLPASVFLSPIFRTQGYVGGCSRWLQSIVCLTQT